MRKGYDPYNSHEARRKASDTVDFAPPASETVAQVRKAQAAHIWPEGLDWSEAEHVVMENGK